jgi:D-inositol-3-phosphate glycosyltransferase
MLQPARLRRVHLVSEHASPLAVLGSVDAGGQNVHVAHLAEGLAALGVDVVVHTRRDDPALPRQVPLAPGVVVDHVDAGPAAPIPKDELLPYMGEFAEDLARVWRTSRPGVVFSHFWMSGLAAVQAARPLGIPVVHTFHALGLVKRRNQGTNDTSPAARVELEAFVGRSVDRVIATSADEMHELVDMGVDEGRIHVVPCGVDLTRFTPGERPYCRRAGRRRVLVLSRLVERKGIGNAIEAITMLPDVDLVIAGGPPAALVDDDAEAARFMDLATRLGVVDRVELVGGVAREHVPSLLRSADVVVCCPWYEPFGIVAVEAMACGVPVVASKIGGLAETVIDGVTGFHVPPRAPRRVAAALETLLANESLRRSMGVAGVERARRYGWPRIAGETYDVLAALPSTDSNRSLPRSGAVMDRGRDHIASLREALCALDGDTDRIARWGRRLAMALSGGRRLLVAGNGGSAAEAQHLTAELVGRYCADRQPFSAIALHAETSSITAIANDYAFDEVFARQVYAHGRHRDILIALSTSGRSANLMNAARAAHERGLDVWAMTGPGPNPLVQVADDAIVIDAPAPTVQEVHLVAVHLLCAEVDAFVSAPHRELAETS